MDSGMRKEAKKVAIIGAGISGIVACKHAVEKGFDPIVFEARSCIGGVWSSTIHSTKLQTPKDYFQFSDFPWPDFVLEDFPHHKQVLEYVRSYALHFEVVPRISFGSKVTALHYSDAAADWTSGQPFSSTGKWSLVVQDVLHPLHPPKVYEMDFVILCIGKFSDLPNIPDFSSRASFNGEVLHTMNYAAMDKMQAAKFTQYKRVTVVGFQKSAVDTAAEIARNNGAKHPCTLVFRRVHWCGSETLVKFTFKNLTRFSQLMVHKPAEGLILCFLAFVLSPLRWMFCKVVEWYMGWIYPLKKYKMVPDHSFLNQIYSCMFMILPSDFYHRVEQGSLVLRKSTVAGFYESGLLLDGGTTRLDTDVVIFATGYKSDEKIAAIFSSPQLKKCITGSSAPLYRECIHPRIPQLAIMGYSESPATLFTFEMRSKWVAHFLAGRFRLPPVAEMEENARRWEANARRYSRQNYKRGCVGVMLQLHCNDEICRDIGSNPRRKKCLLSHIFSPYRPSDYAHL
ncbi:probable flavin-containing monooxygenase 1 [Salvia miltiorrhiza]|uniref:probable flavin-containing monooxygenase 1 n=1 Tax=Salvia miltiorrhiza TaxID=226208 RepID=UPI0025ACB80A|nr:probable flavin-containing monooxygenase 1 [Salvia miltiorrhiza]